MTKYIIALIWCMAFWGGFISGQSAFASETYYKNKNSDLLNVKVTCINSNMTSILTCQTFASMKHNWNDGVSVQKEIVRSGKVAYEFTNAPGECGWNDSWNDCKNDRERTELSMSQFAKNGVKWAKFSIYIPEETNCTQGVSCSLWQLHTKSGQPAYMLRWKYNQLMMSDFPNAEGVGPKEHYIVRDVESIKGKWLDFVVYIEQYDRPKKGKLVMWLNGEKVVDHFGYRKNFRGKNNYMKFGIYKSWISRAQTERKPMKIYYDSITIAYDCKSLNVKKEGYNCKNFQING